MKINNGAKAGIMIEIIAFVTMLLLVLFNQTIPSVVSWLFVGGLVMAVVSTLTALAKINYHRCKYN